MAKFRPYQSASGGELMRTGMDMMRMQKMQQDEDWRFAVAKWQQDQKDKANRGKMIGAVLGLGAGMALSAAGAASGAAAGGAAGAPASIATGGGTVGSGSMTMATMAPAAAPVSKLAAGAAGMGRFGAAKLGMNLGGAAGTSIGGGDPGPLLREVGETLSYFTGRDAKMKDRAAEQDYWKQRLSASEEALANRPYTLSPGQRRMGPGGEIARGGERGLPEGVRSSLIESGYDPTTAGLKKRGKELKTKKDTKAINKQVDAEMKTIMGAYNDIRSLGSMEDPTRGQQAALTKAKATFSSAMKDPYITHAMQEGISKQRVKTRRPATELGKKVGQLAVPWQTEKIDLPSGKKRLDQKRLREGLMRKYSEKEGVRKGGAETPPTEPAKKPTAPTKQLPAPQGAEGEPAIGEIITIKGEKFEVTRYDENGKAVVKRVK